MGLPQANPSLFAKVFARAKGMVFCREGLARYACPSLVACREGPCKQQSATNSIRVLFVYTSDLVSKLPSRLHKQKNLCKIAEVFVALCPLRKERDSNPRTREDQRFKTAAFDHSAIFPDMSPKQSLAKARQKYDLISKFATSRVAISLLCALFLPLRRRSGSCRSEIPPSPSLARR